MNSVKNLIKRFFPPATPLQAGNFQFHSPAGEENPLHLNLRIEPGGSGILIINAHTVLHLNQTATEYVFHLVRETPEQEVGKIFADRYNISPTQALLDFNEIREKIRTLILTPDLDPVTFLDIERTSLYSGALSAPYRLDCALTYRQMGDVPSEIAPIERVRQELQTSEWEVILEKVSQAGIPHVVFTGGEPTLRKDLVDLINFAGKCGIVTGLLTNGHKLSEPDYLRKILVSGLDHVMIMLDSASAVCWKAITDVAAEDLAVTVHFTLTEENLPSLSESISRLAHIGIRNISLSAIHPELKERMMEAQALVAEAGMTLVWDLPVPYSIFNPVNIELEGFEEAPQGAGKAWLYIEPDGDVLPRQGVGIVLGNLRDQSWDEVWNNRLS